MERLGVVFQETEEATSQNGLLYGHFNTNNESFCLQDIVGAMTNRQLKLLIKRVKTELKGPYRRPAKS